MDGHRAAAGYLTLPLIDAFRADGEGYRGRDAIERAHAIVEARAAAMPVVEDGPVVDYPCGPGYPG